MYRSTCMKYRSILFSQYQAQYHIPSKQVFLNDVAHMRPEQDLNLLHCSQKPKDEELVSLTTCTQPTWLSYQYSYSQQDHKNTHITNENTDSYSRISSNMLKVYGWGSNPNQYWKIIQKKKVYDPLTFLLQYILKHCSLLYFWVVGLGDGAG